LTAPSGRTAYRWGPVPRRMRGSMDLTIEDDLIEDAVLDEAGTYVASFILDDQVIGEVEVPVFLQEAPTSLPKHVEDGLKRSDVIWVGVPENERQRHRFPWQRKPIPGPPTLIPAWFAY